MVPASRSPSTGSSNTPPGSLGTTNRPLSARASGRSAMSGRGREEQRGTSAVTSPGAIGPLEARRGAFGGEREAEQLDRKSTRLNSSHVSISYAVFCLKKKKKHNVRDDN